MISNLILALGFMILVGFVAGSFAHRLKFPRVTGYIILGIVLSPSVTGIVGQSTVEQLETITTVALGIIAYAVGGSLRLAKLREHEKSILWITPLQALGALLVTAILCMMVLPSLRQFASGGQTTYLSIALTLGAIASATAPATILAIIRELKSKGPMTTTLLSVVAIDDAVAILLFSITLGLSQALSGGVEGLSPSTMLIHPGLEIGKSLGFGFICGLLLVRTGVLAQARSLMLALVLGAITLCVGLTEVFGGSSLLANMVLGATVANGARDSSYFEVVDYIEDAVFAVFFVLSGLHFSLSAMQTAGLLGLVAAIGRGVGKYLGTGAGARLAGAPPQVGRYLGLALLPAAGVSIGLALVAQSALPEHGSLLYNTVLVMVVINEIVGPLSGERALRMSGEARS